MPETSHQVILEQLTSEIRKSSVELGEYVEFFGKSSDNGVIPDFIERRTELMYKAAYTLDRLRTVLGAMSTKQTNAEVAELMNLVVEDCLERGFTRADIRHNSTNEMSNIGRRWAVECEAKLYGRYAEWKRYCKRLTE